MKETPQNLKQSAGKPEVDILEPEFLEEMAKIGMYGNNVKYKVVQSWKQGITLRKFLGAIFRHYLAIRKGEDIDSDHGAHHVAAIAYNCMMYYWTLKNKPELDDRYIYDGYGEKEPEEDSKLQALGTKKTLGGNVYDGH
jgi:hypothetical protein